MYATLQKNNISYVGAGSNLEEAIRPTYVEKKMVRQGKLIFYSLGNRIFDAVTPAATKSMVVEFKIKKGDAEIILHPIYISNSQTFSWTRILAKNF
ncbi:hypothetical protein HYG87_09860 [Methanobacterium alkalithermotolerans]|uniref:Uncharacterized protein n=1 Tax=Methanobacterium alkalithermotolerans TaxID=2731220 RepID=A0A8T8K610_9EURY|nr:hypothetical protein [Methanobacterium alkalithermotolerans]QUH24038.1 hypothetical protein HYG87_09860 [Methanobacterium alkalithermotolerans]